MGEPSVYSVRELVTAFLKQFVTAFLRPKTYPDVKISHRLARQIQIGRRRKMQSQPVPDQRQHPRRDASLVVSYRPKDPTAGHGIGQTRNISQGGMLLTTARAFAPGDRLVIRTRPPFLGSPRLVPGTAQVVGSREIVQSFLYETRLRFVDLDRRSSQIIGHFCTGKADVLAACGD